jgi:hypothetical protein
MQYGLSREVNKKPAEAGFVLVAMGGLEPPTPAL